MSGFRGMVGIEDHGKGENLAAGIVHHFGKMVSNREEGKMHVYGTVAGVVQLGQMKVFSESR